VPRETKRLRQQNGCLLEQRPGSALFCLKHISCGQKWKCNIMSALKKLDLQCNRSSNHDSLVHIMRHGKAASFYAFFTSEIAFNLTKVTPYMLNLFWQTHKLCGNAPTHYWIIFIHKYTRGLKGLKHNAINTNQLKFLSHIIYVAKLAAEHYFLNINGAFINRNYRTEASNMTHHSPLSEDMSKNDFW